MERRTFLKTTVAGSAGLAAGGLAGCGGGSSGGGPAVHATKRVRWRLASSFPRSLDTIFGAAEVLADRVEAMTGGNFTIRVYPAGEIVPALQELDAVQQGTVQVGQTAGYYYTGKNPALAFDTCVPFGLTPRQQNAWLFEGGGLELVHELCADFDSISFPCGNTGTQMGGWFKREIGSVEDLRGLSMRIPGLGGQVMSALGVTVQVLAGGDIYPALERGAIDATEWVGPYDDEKLGFHKAAKNYYYPGWWEPGPSLSFFVNVNDWADLPASYQEIFRAASREAASAMQTRYDQKNPAAFQRLIDYGTNIQPFSNEILVAAREAASQYYADTAAADPVYRRVFEQWSKFRESAFRWFGTAELAYADFAFRA